MSKYANNSKAFGFCDVCGFRCDLNKMKKLVIKTKQTEIKACPTCWVPDQPQLKLGMWPIFDPQALNDPRPDTGLAASREIPSSTITFDDYMRIRK